MDKEPINPKSIVDESENNELNQNNKTDSDVSYDSIESSEESDIDFDLDFSWTNTSTTSSNTIMLPNEVTHNYIYVPEDLLEQERPRRANAGAGVKNYIPSMSGKTYQTELQMQFLQVVKDCTIQVQPEMAIFRQSICA